MGITVKTEIGQQVRKNKAWQEEGFDPVTVAVNISPKQFRHQDVVNVVIDALCDSKLNPMCLQLEITETAVMDNVELAISKLKQLHEMGVVISIDDFGMGYSSLSRLKTLPISSLKIDRSFIQGLPEDRGDCAIVRTILDLGRHMNFMVVAEGVETDAQLVFLRQSYLFYRSNI